MLLYDQEEIDKVQSNQLYILKEFAKFCDKHEIDYTLDYGTMLGAVREKGFIPWDDDVDVAMLRSDYDRFLELAGNNLNSELFIQNYNSDPGFIHAFSRIRLNGSLALQEDWKNLDCHHGIFIDIFPYDTIPTDKRKRIEHQYLIHIIQEAKLYRVKMLGEAEFDKSKTLQESPLSLLTLERLNIYHTQIITKYNNGFTANDDVTHMTQGFKSYLEFQRTVDEHRDTKTIKFEDDTYPIPKAFDKLLSNVYNDYMSYPPKEDRAPHHGVIKYQTRDI